MMKKVRTPEPEMFTDFWAIWQPVSRHTDGRGLARDTFRKHVLNGADPQDIVDGARWFVRNMSDRDRDFVPLSSTWINREAYLDLCEKERAFQERSEALKAHQSSSENVVQMPRTVRPKNHFLNKWESGEIKKSNA